MLERILKLSAICVCAVFITGCGNLDAGQEMTAEQIHAAPAQPELPADELMQADTLVIYRDLSQSGKKLKISLTCGDDGLVRLQVGDKIMELFELNQIYGKSQFNPYLFTFEKYVVIPEVMQYEGGLVYGNAMWLYAADSDRPVKIVTDTQKIKPEQFLQWYAALSKADDSINFNNYALVSHGAAYNKKDTTYVQLYTYLDNEGNLCLLTQSGNDLSNDFEPIVFAEKIRDGAIDEFEHFYGEIKTVEDSSNENSYALISCSFAGASSSPVSSWLYNLNSGEISNFSDFNYSPDLRCTIKEDADNLIADFPSLNLEEIIPLSQIDNDVLVFLRENDYLDGKTIMQDCLTRSPEQITLVDNKTIALWQRTSQKWMNFPIVTYFSVCDGKRNLLRYEFRRDFRPMGDYIQN